MTLWIRVEEKEEIGEKKKYPIFSALWNNMNVIIGLGIAFRFLMLRLIFAFGMKEFIPDVGFISKINQP